MVSSNWESPLIWIDTKKDGNLVVVPETANKLREINKPVVVVAIAGLYRTGKSYLMNILARKYGFDLGPTVEPKTKGIWIWCVDHPHDSDLTLVLIDTEGLSDPKKGDEKHDMSLFTLAVLLSSTFIFNTMGRIDQKMIDDLHFVTKLSKNVRVKSSKNEDDEETEMTEFTEFFPAFILAVRDFTLELKLNDKEVTPNEYFNSVLELRSGWSNAAFNYNLPRRAIRNAFRKHFCFVFKRPVNDERLFVDLAENKLPESKLCPQFLRQSKEFYHYVLSTSTEKMIRNGQKANGSLLQFMAEEYVKAINEGAIPCIESTLTSVTERENNRILEESLEKYKSIMNELDLPLHASELDTSHRRASQETAKHFKRGIMLDNEGKWFENFLRQLTVEFGKFIRQNEETSSTKCSELLNKLYESILGVGVKNQSYCRKGGYAAYNEDFQRLLQKYDDEPKKGVKDEDVKFLFLKEKENERDIILSADEVMTKKEQELEASKNAERLQELEKIAKEEELKAEKERAKMMEDDFENQKDGMKKEYEQREESQKKEMEEIFHRRLEECERLQKEGFEKEAQELRQQITELKKPKKSALDFICEIADRVLNAAPLLLAMRHVGAPPRRR